MLHHSVSTSSRSKGDKMSERELIVYRERLGRFEEVGPVGVLNGVLTFSYSDSYR